MSCHMHYVPCFCHVCVSLLSLVNCCFIFRPWLQRFIIILHGLGIMCGLGLGTCGLGLGKMISFTR